MSEARRPWRQYICLACGLIYDEELGDPDGDLPPGTRFEDIPEDWECPLCGVGKSDFELYEPPAAVAAPPIPIAAPVRDGVVIIGAGLAGWSVAEALRALDPELPISLVTACDGDLYHKPELSVALSRDLTATALARESGADAARRLGIRLLSQTCAVGLSPALRRLRTTRGTLGYRALILAHGARPALPPALPAHLCWRINHLQGWAGLQRSLAGGARRVAVVGAGMIGCELAEDLSHAGHHVTLIDRAPQPLASLLPDAAVARLRAHLESLGVTFLGGVNVAGITPSGDNGKALTTECGRVLQVDQVVAATGLITESRLARQAGLAFQRGILVDNKLATSVPGIYALGDCVSLDGAPCRFIEPIARQAETIAHAVLDLDHPGYGHRAPVIRLKTRQLPIVLRGERHSDQPWHVLQAHNDYLLMEQRRHGRPVATLSVGRPPNATDHQPTTLEMQP